MYWQFLVLLFVWGCGDDGNEVNVDPDDPRKQVLIFTKTEGFRHSSISDGVALFKGLAEEEDIALTHTENAGVFNSDDLPSFDLVIFLSTTGDILNNEQQTAFENYIGQGGAFMGIHAATDTEYDWPWYGELVGAYFDSHPSIQEALITVVDPDHPATAHLNDTWTRRDEWYNFKNFNPSVNTLLNLEESSYEGGTNGPDHPIAWYHEPAGARVFYTAGGHTAASYSEPGFVQHLRGGMLWCLE